MKSELTDRIWYVILIGNFGFEKRRPRGFFLRLGAGGGFLSRNRPS